MKGIRSRLISYLDSLRFPWLLLLTAVVFLLNLFVPDPLPFADEILLALVTLLLSRLKRKPPQKDSNSKVD